MGGISIIISWVDIKVESGKWGRGRGKGDAHARIAGSEPDARIVRDGADPRVVVDRGAPDAGPLVRRVQLLQMLRLAV